MGNHGSRRMSRGHRCRCSRWGNELSDDEQIPTEDFEGTSPNSYDKLMAWMVEMAENADEDLHSPEVVEHLTAVCAEKNSSPSKRQNSLEAPVRQHSLDSNHSSLCSRSSRSREGILHRDRLPMLSRQNTVDYSDDSDALSDTFVVDRFDSDIDIDCFMPHTVMTNNVGASFFTNSFRPSNQSCTTYRNYNTSNSDLLNLRSRKRSKRKIRSESWNNKEITPIYKGTIASGLDDDMLDRNIGCILYSVEALWPKGPNYNCKL